MTRPAYAAAALVLLFARGLHAQPAEPEPQPAEPPPAAAEPEPAPAPAAVPAPGPHAPDKARPAAPLQPAPAAAPTAEEETPTFVFKGYVAPGFDFKARPDATPLTRTEYAFRGDAGLIFEATPLKYWQARLELKFSVVALHYVESVTFIDTDGDGVFDIQRRTDKDQVLGNASIEDATLTFRPLDPFGIKAGIFRIPFTAANQSPNTGTMFATRAPPSELFLSGADIGGLLLTRWLDGRIEGSAGAFNGQSLGLRILELETRGLVYALRADVNPFGAFPAWEGDPQRGPFRLGLGFGLLYRPATLYDGGSGEEAATVHDVRYAASLRLAVGGLYVGVEYLHGQQTDSITERPRIADGGYVQASFFIPVTRTFAFAPVGRLGLTAEDRAFAPRTIGWTDLGVTLYPRADAPQPDTLKITLNYAGERRFTEGEDAHGAALSAVLNF